MKTRPFAARDHAMVYIMSCFFAHMYYIFGTETMGTGAAPAKKCVRVCIYANSQIFIGTVYYVLLMVREWIYVLFSRVRRGKPFCLLFHFQVLGVGLSYPVGDG